MQEHYMGSHADIVCIIDYYHKSELQKSIKKTNGLTE